MLIHPDVQKKAQEEIDKACNGHLPTLQDVQEDLPYVMAVVLEVMRWSAPAPSGMEKIYLKISSALGILIHVPRRSSLP